MDINAVEQTCHKGCGWREAYMRQTEIVKAMMEESNVAFIKTRDIIGLLKDISQEPAKTTSTAKRSSFNWK